MVSNGKPIDVYVRVSSKGDRDEGSFGSPDTQVQIGTAYLTANNLPIGIELPHDIDKSGTIMERPGLDLAIERIQTGQSGGIVFAYQSRYARNLEGALATLKEVQKYGGILCGPGIADVSTPEGYFQFSMQGANDEYMARRKREDAHLARIRAVNIGRHMGKFVPVGYSKVDGKLIPNEDAPAILEAFKLRAAGKGPKEIADTCLKGIITSHGQEITRTSAWQILHNPVYMGELTYKQKGKVIASNPEAHEPIVDPVLFQAAQQKKMRPGPTGRESLNSCVGILRCSKCKLTLTATHNGNGSRFYRCAKCKPKLHVGAAMIEPLIEDIFIGFIEDIRIAEYEDTPETSALKAEYESASLAYDQLFNDTELRELDYTNWRDTLTSAKNKRDTLAAKYNEVKSLAQEITDNPIFEANLFDHWESYTASQKNELYRWAFNSITIKRKPNKQFDIDIEFTPVAAHFLTIVPK